MPDYIHRAIVEAYIKTAAHQMLSAETIEGILAPWQSSTGQPAFYRQIAQADSGFTHVFQHRFDEVSCDTLILWGEQDTWIPCEQAHVLHQKIQGSRSRFRMPDTW